MSLLQYQQNLFIKVPGIGLYPDFYPRLCHSRPQKNPWLRLSQQNIYSQILHSSAHVKNSKLQFLLFRLELIQVKGINRMRTADFKNNLPFHYFIFHSPGCTHTHTHRHTHTQLFILTSISYVNNQARRVALPMYGNGACC